ncbi:ImmA/IrrE family metallo-endopeptidase [Candidatus Rariloculus sp.]|uniref:ImmA/IrrE family metallo-endopeptidase n=1 Tax=Candidatus Rariloculus sp. TaxID=3101265 RepID=UPI003D13E02D
MSRRHEVRADAFAGRFLMPTRGVERYLHSIGRDTMGSRLAGVLEVFSDRAAVPKDKSRRRRALSADRIEQIAVLSGLDDEDRVRLLATGDSGPAEDRDSGRRRLA